MDSFYKEEELKEIGFKEIGKNVKISRKTSIYGASNIKIGSNVRIDDFCILSGKIEIGNHVHISAFVALYGGKEGIFLEDYVGISARSTVYSSSDDYTGEALTNPTIPDKYRKVQNEAVYVERHVLVGCNSVLLPGVTLKEGSSFGSFSFIIKDSEAWSMNKGIPAQKYRDRKKDLLLLERKMLEETTWD